jgi:hypothetical protein
MYYEWICVYHPLTKWMKTYFVDDKPLAILKIAEEMKYQILHQKATLTI